MISLLAALAFSGQGPALLFCVPRETPIRSVDGMNQAWIEQSSDPRLTAKAVPGEFFVFQVGVLARQNIHSVSTTFSGLPGQARCISLGGIGPSGRAFQKHLSIPSGRLQTLWCGWDVPLNAHGPFHGIVSINLDGHEERVKLNLNVEGSAVPDHGADRPETLARLRWLDSSAGQGTSIPKPYLPVKASGSTVHILGRDLELSDTGLPLQVLSHFSAANTRIEKAATPLLGAPMEFLIGDQPLHGKLESIDSSGEEAHWKASGVGLGFRYELNGKLDFTGSGQIAVRLTAEQAANVGDLRLEIPYAKESATYLMGLDHKGGLRPNAVSWKWNVAKHQDCFWMGAVNAGMMVRLKDANFRRPLVNIYYGFLPLLLPDSWGNGGKGGVEVSESGSSVVAKAYSGSRTVKKGQVLDFIFDFYLTPFRTIDTDRQWATRFDHPHPTREPKSSEDALSIADPKAGPNVINIHQAGYYNPYINYPYSPDSFPAFTDFVKRAHAKGVEARVYYTTREITQNMPELFALHSLNGEVVFPGPGKDAKTLIHPNGPDPWLVQNLGSDFIPAWEDHIGGKYAEKDLSVITTPDSRWNNFYLEGLKWMVDRAKIDGIYIDDTALDSLSLRRARRILATRPNPIIDLHSWNHFNEWAGYGNNLNIYMEVLPYLDRLWLGEGFPASEASPDYWLVEMSGIPFGLMSEMLDEPNWAKGLVFGETTRLNWSGDPRPIWKLWDEYGMKGTAMIPFFDPGCPVKTDHPGVLATVYRGKGQTMVALGNWAPEAAKVSLKIDWKALGLNSASTRIIVPEIAGLQPPQTWSADKPLEVPAKSGLVVVLREVETG